MKKVFSQKLLLFVLIMYCTISAYGQTRKINGTVYNSETKEAIPKIKVSVKNTQTSTITNEQGFFEIEVPADLRTVSFSDFEGKTVQEVRIINSDTYDIYLSELVDIFDLSLEDLMNIEVQSAAKAQSKIEQIPASAVVVTREDIEAYGYKSLTEILEHVTGMYFIDDHAHKGPIFGVRGFLTHYPKNIMVLVNGVDYQRKAISGWEFSRIPVPVEAIDKIEIIRGPMSIVYGSGAFFGVINELS